jgi:hypothetical protein
MPGPGQSLIAALGRYPQMRLAGLPGIRRTSSEQRVADILCMELAGLAPDAEPAMPQPTGPPEGGTVPGDASPANVRHSTMASPTTST